MQKVQEIRVVLIQNQGGNLGIAVEIKWESNGNDKFKEWREINITKNERICNNLVLHI